MSEIAGNIWCRAVIPIIALIGFELLTRYLGKSDRQRLKADDFFVALPLLGASIAALPGLIALRSAHHPSQAEVSLGGFVLVLLVLIACWLVVFDRRTMRRYRRGNVRWKRLACTLIPNFIAAIILGLVFAYAP